MSYVIYMPKISYNTITCRPERQKKYQVIRGKLKQLQIFFKCGFNDKCQKYF